MSVVSCQTAIMNAPFSKTATALALLLFLSPAARAEKKVVAYVPNWINLEAFSKSIDYGKLTHINIAFENPVDAAGNLSFNPANRFVITKARANGVKVLISIGGGSASGDEVLKPRYFALLTKEKRPGFIAKLTAYVIEHKFDGIDVDIEGPSINADYGDFIRDLSNSLRPREKLLTSALSKGYGGDRVPDSVFKFNDFINIMAYDATGYWDPQNAGPHSPLSYAKSSVKYWLDRGLPKSKAVLGLPFYGYGFGEAFHKEEYPYKEIVKTWPGAENLSKVGNTIWYNGIPLIQEKTRHVIDQDLAGVMIWSLDSDAKGSKSLLTAIHQTLHR